MCAHTLVQIWFVYMSYACYVYTESVFPLFAKHVVGHVLRGPYINMRRNFFPVFDLSASMNAGQQTQPLCLAPRIEKVVSHDVSNTPNGLLTQLSIRLYSKRAVLTSNMPGMWIITKSAKNLRGFSCWRTTLPSVQLG